MHKWNARRNFRSVMTMRNPTTPPKPLTHPSSDRDPSRTLSSLVFTGQGIQSTGPFNVSGNIIINQNGNVANVREAEADRKREELEKKRKELEKKRKELERKRKELEKKHKHRQALLKTLQFDQMDSRQLTIQKEYPKTCKWFLQDEAYCEWMRNQESGDAGNFLWIKGKPGAGKSTMMKFLLEYTRRNKRGPKVISFFFNARGDTMEKNTLGLYRSLVVQLLELYPALLSVLDKYRSSIKWNVNSAKGLFSETVEALGKIPVICFIDALDECKEQEVRDMIACLSGLCEIGKKLNICLASRHYPNITIMKGRSIVLEDKVEHQRDIADYIDSTLCIRNESALGEIRSDLLKKASGVFMWVVLVVNILNKAYDTTGLRGLRKRLADIPDDLDTLFRDMLSRDTINTPNLLLCIQWVLFARRPLKPMELYLAIISASKPENLADYHAGDITDDEIAKFVLDTSKGLAELTKSEHPTIQFIHESVREVLLKENGLQKVWPVTGASLERQSHQVLKQACLAYMTSELVTASLSASKLKRHWPKEPDFFYSLRDRFPFLEYTNENILFHANRAEKHGSSQKGFLQDFSLFDWVIHHNLLYPDKDIQYKPSVSFCYILAERNLYSLIEILPESNSCFNVEAERYGPPIFAALATKSTEAVQALIQSHQQNEEHKRRDKPSVNLSYLLSEARSCFKVEKERYGALSFATLAMGSTKFLQALTRRYRQKDTASQFPKHVSLNISDYEEWSSSSTFHHGFSFSHQKGVLYYLIRAGLEKLLDIFCTAEQIDRKFWGKGRGLQALTCAAMYGHVGVAQLLLDRGANVNAANSLGERPLFVAVFNEHTEMIKVLIDNGADINAANSSGETLLFMALYRGLIEVVKVLIQNGADVNAANSRGRTALIEALDHDMIGMVKMLLENGADANAADCDGRKPLIESLRRGKTDMAGLFMEHGALNVGDSPRQMRFI